MTNALELDSADKAIIAELQVDGRVPYAKLAPLVGLSEAATRQRVNRLMERGVMQVVAITDPDVVGLGHQALIGIHVDSDTRPVADQLAQIDEVDYVVITAGRYDIIVEVFCSNVRDFLAVVEQKIRPAEGVRDLEILTYLDLVKQTYNWGIR